MNYFRRIFTKHPFISVVIAKLSPRTGTHASLMEMKGLYFTLVAAQESSQEVEAEEMEQMEDTNTKVSWESLVN